MLRAGDLRGMRWLVSAQLYLMALILSYAAARFARPDIGPLRAVVTEELAEQIRMAGMTVDQMLVQLVRVVYGGVAAATLLYQGGMILYYLRRRAAVAEAIEGEDPL